MINGQEYAFEDITLVLLGRPVIGIQGITYNTTKEHVNIMGFGNKPVSMGRGSKNFEASITLLQSEVEAIQQSIDKGKALPDLAAFDVIVSYAPLNGTLVVDILKKCRFTAVPKGLNTDETHMVIEIPMLPFDIEYNA